ncbi:MAG: hypothetical protein RMJ59_06335 [Candidatus Nitrosocaldus sp.]|nr:hypothetical protein [Candidatus Nitrosocaldus sp.]MDW8275980.1 hypothetical protein [Candidatus Nitrosocaldus sp.]
MHKRQMLALSLIALLAVSVMPSALASQIRTAQVFTPQNEVGVEFLSVRVTTIEHPQGGKLKDLLSGVNERVIFRANDGSPGIEVLKEKINEALLEVRSPARVAEVKEVVYNVALQDDGIKVTMQQSLTLKLLLSGIVIQEALYDQPAIIDLNWRGFRVNGQVPITLNADGTTVNMDINTIRGYLEVKHPEVVSLLSRDSKFSEMLDDPLMNYERIGELPITQWHKLINALQSMAEAEKWGVNEPAPAVTVVSAGEGSIREGQHPPRILSAQATIDGSTYYMTIQDPPISATLDIYYWAEPIRDDHGDAARVYLSDPGGRLQQASTGNFPLMVLLTFAGMMGAIAGFVIWRANKK